MTNTSNSLKIVLVEDAENYITELLLLMQRRLGLAVENVEVIRNEVEFYDRLAEWRSSPPAAFLIDVMFPYRDVGESDANVPPEIRAMADRDKFYRAGVRCANSLLADLALRQLPIVLHSILDKPDLASEEKYPIPSAPNVQVCPKESNGLGIISALGLILDIKPMSGTEGPGHKS